MSTSTRVELEVTMRYRMVEGRKDETWDGDEYLRGGCWVTSYLLLMVHHVWFPLVFTLLSPIHHGGQYLSLFILYHGVSGWILYSLGYLY